MIKLNSDIVQRPDKKHIRLTIRSFILADDAIEFYTGKQQDAPRRSQAEFNNHYVGEVAPAVHAEFRPMPPVQGCGRGDAGDP